MPADQPSDSQPWFVPLVSRPDARWQVFGFPNAGAGPSVLAACARSLPGEIEMWSVNLPGRDSRFLESSRTNLGVLVNELAADLAVRTRVAYSLFGYCSGALMAYLVAQRVRQLGATPPSHIFVASYGPPDVPNRSAVELTTLPEQDFWNRVVGLGGVPDDVAALPDAHLVFEPALRADYTLTAQYRHTGEPALDAPITALVGAADTSLTPELLTGWSRHTLRQANVRTLPAGHWLLSEAPADVSTCIEMVLATGPQEPTNRRF
jgi:surfactin synthase thioesterase subunit